MEKTKQPLPDLTAEASEDPRSRSAPCLGKFEVPAGPLPSSRIFRPRPSFINCGTYQKASGRGTLGYTKTSTSTSISVSFCL